MSKKWEKYQIKLSLSLLNISTYVDMKHAYVWLKVNDSRHIFDLLWLYLGSDKENDNQWLIKSKKAIDAQ